MSDENERQIHDLHGKPLASFKVESTSESPETEDELDTDEATSMLLHYTEETLGVAEDKLAISSLPYNVETYFLGPIRLVSIQKDYVPYIPELFHNNIIAQYGLLVSKNNDYFLMLENTIGKSFQRHLAESTEEMNVSWIYDVSNGLNYLHFLNFWYGELSLDRMQIHGTTLKLEHPAVCERYGQGVEQDLQELCKFIKKISTDERLEELSEYIENGTIKNASEVCQYLEGIIHRNTKFQRSEVVPMEVNYLGGEDNLERINQMNAPSNEPLPMCGLVKESDLGQVESLERDKTDTELERISSGAFRCVFLRVRLDGSTRALMSGHSMYETLKLTRPNEAQMVEEERLIKTADRIPKICFDITEHPFVLQPRFMVGPSKHLNEVTDILYENAPLGTLYKHVERENTHFDDTTILQFACQLATAIVYCHQKLNIMHRNINSKSTFVFQAPTGRFYLKLGGFVYAKVSRGDANSANMNMILRFSAPETLQDSSGVAFYSYSSDIWSYGMVLDYIAHDGRNPFDKLNHRSRLRRALWEDNVRPVLRADLHCDLVMLIKACYRSERRGDNGRILPLETLRPTAVEVRSFLVDHGHQNEEDGLALLAVAQ